MFCSLPGELLDGDYMMCTSEGDGRVAMVNLDGREWKEEKKKRRKENTCHPLNSEKEIP